MAKLTDTQLVILSTAAQRDDRAVFPLAESLKINESAAAKVFKSLLAKKLIEERPAALEETAWRTEDDRRFTLVVTDAGFAALNSGPEETPAPAKPQSKPKSKSKPAQPPRRTSKAKTGTSARAGGKVGMILSLLQRSSGATIVQLQKATGWQPHSVRAALTGLRKQKHKVARSQNASGVTVYSVSMK